MLIKKTCEPLDRIKFIVSYFHEGHHSSIVSSSSCFSLYFFSVVLVLVQQIFLKYKNVAFQVLNFNCGRSTNRFWT